MDAFIVSAYVKNSLKSRKSKKIEHAAFIVNTPSSSNYNKNKINNMKFVDNSTYLQNNDNSTVVDNSDNSTLADNSDTYKYVDSSDNSATAISNTNNSSNITVNNIKVTTDAASKLVTNHKDQEDYEDEDDEEEEYQNNNKATKISNITFILMLIINSYSAYLSWECNSKKGYPLVLKVVFSFFAFVFGSLYLLYYILFKFDDCNKFNSN